MAEETIVGLNGGVQLDLEFDLDYFVTAAEAALFAVGSALSFDKLAQALGLEGKQTAYIPVVLEELKKRYAERQTAIEVVLMDGFAQLCTKSVYGDIVRRALEIRKNQPLSKAALEVLAVIAYNQPTTRAFVEKVRGVESPSVIATLAEKGLIEERGRLDAPGRPVLYGTTPVFLRTFGLASLDELGPAPEIDGVPVPSGSFSEALIAQTTLDENQITFDEDVFEGGDAPEGGKDGDTDDGNGGEDRMETNENETIIKEGSAEE